MYRALVIRVGFLTYQETNSYNYVVDPDVEAALAGEALHTKRCKIIKFGWSRGVELNMSTIVSLLFSTKEFLVPLSQ